MINRIFLYPFIQSHWTCFESLVPLFIEQGFDVIVIEDRQQQNGNWSELVDENKCVNRVADVRSYIIGEQDVLLVGNDSDRPTVKWIQYFQAHGAIAIMLQDGWLVSKNILRPIYRTPSLTMKMRWWTHYLLVRQTSWGKKRFHNFLCQNADYFFVYSEFSKKELIQAGVAPDRVWLTGSPKHQFLKEKRDQKPVGVWILFSTISYSETDLQDTLTCISALLAMRECKKLLVKLHPDEEVSKYAALSDPKLELVTGNFTEVIEQQHISFGFCFASTVVLDLLMLNIPVIQLAVNGMHKRYANYFKDLSLVQDLNRLEQEMAEYNLSEMQARGQKYLLDLKDDVDSRKKVLDAIKQLR